jgi:hypothetical protein
MHRFIALALLLIPLASCRTAGLSPQIPDGYVPTPHGLVHRSCVRAVPPGHRLDADGTVISPSGERRTTAPCPYPRLDPQSRTPMELNPPQVNGWVVSAGWTSTVPIGSLTASFVVPPAPADSGALIYFFPGMTSTPIQGIIQPVLQYGAGIQGGGNYWMVMSWNCCAANSSWYSPGVTVSTGDTIVGSMNVSCSGGTCTGQVVTTDATTGDSTTLLFTRSTTPYINAAGGALEVHGVNACGQFPASGTIAFTDITLTDQNGNPLQPVWTPNVRSRKPDCGYSATTTATTVTLDYLGNPSG